MIVLDILLWTLLVLGVLLGLLLLMPLHFEGRGEVVDDDASWRLRVAWAFGFLSITADRDGAALRLVGLRVARLRAGDEDPEEREKKRRAREAKRRAKAEKRGREPRPRRGLRWFLANRRLLARILGRYVRALHLRGRVEGVLGLPDPDQTATAHQVLTVLDAALPEGVLDVELEWAEEVVDLGAHLGGWVWPAQVAVISLALWLDRKTWRALRAA